MIPAMSPAMSTSSPQCIERYSDAFCGFFVWTRIFAVNSPFAGIFWKPESGFEPETCRLPSGWCLKMSGVGSNREPEDGSPKEPQRADGEGLIRKFQSDRPEDPAIDGKSPTARDDEATRTFV